MTNTPNSQSQKRNQESLNSLFKPEAQTEHSVLILKSSSDVGVMRNGGRNGARYAPQSLLAFFKKLTQSETLKAFSFLEKEVSSSDEEQKDFARAQHSESERIQQLIKLNPSSHLWHIGGGHDHIYPLLKAYSHAKKIIVINIDAHADTRTDDDAHSGTPFRQFAREFQGEFQLYQIGLHSFANSFSTLSTLEKGEQKILWRNEINEKSDAFFEAIRLRADGETKIIFSLDADALAGDIVPGVSAVNGDGLSLEELQDLWVRYLKLTKHQPILGIYELNPVYDTLSGLSMRALSAFLYFSLNKTS